MVRVSTFPRTRRSCTTLTPLRPSRRRSPASKVRVWPKRSLAESFCARLMAFTSLAWRILDDALQQAPEIARLPAREAAQHPVKRSDLHLNELRVHLATLCCELDALAAVVPLQP